MTDHDPADEWEPITTFTTKAEAQALLREWEADHGEIDDSDLRTDIGMASDGKSVYRFQRRRSRDIERR